MVDDVTGDQGREAMEFRETLLGKEGTGGGLLAEERRLAREGRFTRVCFVVRLSSSPTLVELFHFGGLNFAVTVPVASNRSVVGELGL